MYVICSLAFFFALFYIQLPASWGLKAKDFEYYQFRDE